MTAPIVKWVGGKTKLLPELCKRMPEQYRMYYEPFFGGGALYFHQCPPNAIVGDFNPHLVNLYMAVQVDVEKVIRLLRNMERNHHAKGKRQRRAYYEAIKEAWNDGRSRSGMTTAAKAAYMLFLNRTCFNGLWRVNSKGEFNVPMGDYAKGHTICDAAKLREAARVLRDTRIRFGDYRSTCSGARDGDFVYFDPPYDPVSSSSNFTGYTSDGFGRDEQIRLANHARDLVLNGARVMLSNSNTRFIRTLYREREFKLHTVSASRAINSDASKRGKVRELIITGGY